MRVIWSKVKWHKSSSFHEKCTTVHCMVHWLLAYFLRCPAKMPAYQMELLVWNIYSNKIEKRKLATHHMVASQLNNLNRILKYSSRWISITHKSVSIPYRLDETRSKLNTNLIYVSPVDIRLSFSLLIFITACLLHFISISFSQIVITLLLPAFYVVIRCDVSDVMAM